METQYFEGNKDCDLFKGTILSGRTYVLFFLIITLFKDTYWFIPRINSSMVLGLIENF